jgi:hypothetical protein
VSALSIELSNKNFFTFGSVSVHGVRTTDVLRKSECDVTVIVDLERRQVVDLLPDRSAVSTATWFKGDVPIIVEIEEAALLASSL